MPWTVEHPGAVLLRKISEARVTMGAGDASSSRIVVVWHGPTPTGAWWVRVHTVHQAIGLKHTLVFVVVAAGRQWREFILAMASALVGRVVPAKAYEMGELNGGRFETRET